MTHRFAPARLWRAGAMAAVSLWCTAAAAVNVAQNTSQIGNPSATTTDTSAALWNNTWELLDGRTWYTAAEGWQHGVYMNPTGISQYNVTLDQRYAIDSVVLWHHPNLVTPGSNIPVSVLLEVFDNGWQTASFSRNVDLTDQFPGGNYGAYADTYTLTNGLAGTAVRWSFDTQQASWTGDTGQPAWIYEIEVHGVAAIAGAVAPVPEPSTWAMMALGLLALTAVGRRRAAAA